MTGSGTSATTPPVSEDGRDSYSPDRDSESSVEKARPGSEQGYGQPGTSDDLSEVSNASSGLPPRPRLTSEDSVDHSNQDFQRYLQRPKYSGFDGEDLGRRSGATRQQDKSLFAESGRGNDSIFPSNMAQSAMRTPPSRDGKYNHEIAKLRAQLQTSQDLNEALKRELDLYESLKSSRIGIGIQSSPSTGSHGIQTSSDSGLPMTLEDHLAEIRSLRLRLEESVKQNDRLRVQLEKQLMENGSEPGEYRQFSYSAWSVLPGSAESMPPGLRGEFSSM